MFPHRMDALGLLGRAARASAVLEESPILPAHSVCDAIAAHGTLPVALSTV